MTRDERAVHNAAFGAAIVGVIATANSKNAIKEDYPELSIIGRIAAGVAVFAHRGEPTPPTDEQIEALYQETRGDHG